MAMTAEQQQAIALASARLRLQQQQQPQEEQQLDTLDTIAKLGGQTARSAITGLASPLSMAADVPALAYNKIANLVQGENQGYRFPEQNQALYNALSKYLHIADRKSVV